MGFGKMMKEFMVSSQTIMGKYMKGIIKTAKEMAMENYFMQTEKYIQEKGMTLKDMELEKLVIKTGKTII